MVFAPQFGLETSHTLHKGGTPLPATDATNKYSWGSMKLHADCTWRAHIQHAADKGRAASYAAAPILRNRIRRQYAGMVFLSLVSQCWTTTPQWHGTDRAHEDRSGAGASAA